MKALLETSTDYGHPYRPLPISLFNRAGRIARKLGLGGRLNADRMIAAAKRKTGLSDFGDEWFMEPLHVLVSSINDEARLNTLGNMLQHTRLVSALTTRLRAEQILKENPHILEINLGRIILIAALQRTGTTALHRLLCSNPHLRGLYSWEMLNPLPGPGEQQGDQRSRISKAKTAARVMRYMAPEFFVVHPIEFDAPEEDIFLLDLSFMSQAPEATMHVPTYANWLEKQDQTEAYKYMYRMLKLMHWQRSGNAWVLKTPHHMEHIDTILNVFPDIRIVQTHRDPQQSIASFLSMVAHARGILSDHVDAQDIGQHWFRKSLRLMRRSLEARKSREPSIFIDISYDDLVRKPIEALRKIYVASGLPFDTNVENHAKNVANRETKDRYGRHVYRLCDFGIDNDELNRRCAFYRLQYGLTDGRSGNLR
ncbi:MAG: sulfotransferase [Gammaproteobacteria bacterium]|nr:sulfotransferase [Gammaproteobacteria bacterium]